MTTIKAWRVLQKDIPYLEQFAEGQDELTEVS